MIKKVVLRKKRKKKKKKEKEEEEEEGRGKIRIPLFLYSQNSLGRIKGAPARSSERKVRVQSL